ncbi:TetR family transcriptional regulator [Tsukamurella soli]|uniref:TetR family transcriptional regulator n=2 Tax=Tsukamurella soli TaxID=644556 RepID=A0ABP8J5B2_9ACTN
MDIAQAAAELFAARGSRDTTAEDIAQAAGVAPRTFYRYARTKEEAVAPLLDVGGQLWRNALADNLSRLPVADAIEAAIAAVLAPGDPATVAGLTLARRVVAAAADDPALRSVWYRVNCDSEFELARVLRETGGLAVEPARLTAAAATHAVRIAFELWAAGGPSPDPDGEPALAQIAVRCFRGLGGGVEGRARPTADAGGEPGAAPGRACR